MTATPYPELLAETVAAVLEMDAPLETRLALIATRSRDVAPDLAVAVDRMVERLRDTADSATPAVGSPMLPFMLPDETGRLVSLEDLLRGGPVVVAFLRGHWCPYCRVTTRALAATEAAILAAGGRLVAITPERRRFSAALKREAGAGFPVLSDIDNGYALALGLAIWVGAEVQAAMAAGGRDLPSYQGNDGWLLPIPATFVIAPDGRIVARHIDADYRHRMRREEVLAAVRTAATAPASRSPAAD